VRAALSLVLLLTACGAQLGDDDGSHSVRPDALQNNRTPDAGSSQPQPDAAPMVTDNACGVASTLGDLGILTTGSFAGSQLQSGSTTDRVSYVGAPTQATSAQATPDDVYIELWDNYGVFAGGHAKTGTFTISGVETDLDTCGLCVMILANVSNNTATKTMLATSGSVTITSVGTASGQQTKAIINNASFVEVQNVNNDYVPVTSSNCTSPISHAEVRGTL
jgi:hypothetical protein